MATGHDMSPDLRHFGASQLMDGQDAAAACRAKVRPSGQSHPAEVGAA